MDRRKLIFDPESGVGEIPYFGQPGFYRLIARTSDGGGEAAYPGQATVEEAWAMRNSPEVLKDAAEKGYVAFFVHSFRPIVLIEDVTP